MRTWKILSCVGVLVCLGQALEDAPALPVLDQFNVNIDNNGSGWILDGDFRLQQGVRAGRTGLLTEVRLHLDPGEYNVRVFPGKPWVWSEAAEPEGYAIQVAETSWVPVATSLVLAAGDYYTIAVSGVGGVGDTNFYNPPKGYTVPYDGYVHGDEWGYCSDWRRPGIMGCQNEGKTFDLEFFAIMEFPIEVAGDG